jgi:hypothetical protein
MLMLRPSFSAISPLICDKVVNFADKAIFSADKQENFADKAIFPADKLKNSADKNSYSVG